MFWFVFRMENGICLDRELEVMLHTRNSFAVILMAASIIINLT